MGKMTAGIDNSAVIAVFVTQRCASASVSSVSAPRNACALRATRPLCAEMATLLGPKAPPTLRALLLHRHQQGGG
jgi:hypothetical protein